MGQPFGFRPLRQTLQDLGACFDWGRASRVSCERELGAT
jgi:hypothetical protein